MSDNLKPSYQQALDYIYNATPIYRHLNPATIQQHIKLPIITALCQALGNPHKQFKTIHIAGTNGKTSTSHALASILQTAGYKTGLYTSPHIKDFTERIRLNGTNIPKSHIIDFIHQHQPLLQQYHPSFFQISVALAFDFFAQQQVDIAIIEVGLGGILDTTNIILPELSIITNISLDHTAILGNNLTQIAYEKAGIIKPNTPVIIGEYDHNTAPVFQKKAQTQQAPLLYATDTYQIQPLAHTPQQLVVNVHKHKKIWLKHLILDIAGHYQIKNIPAILKAIELLNQKKFTIKQPHLKDGLAHIKKNTNLLGRWQQLATKPHIIADVAHNTAGIAQVITQLTTLNYHQLHIIIGIKNKPLQETKPLFDLLPKHAIYYLVQATISHAMPLQNLQQLANQANFCNTTYPSVEQALQQAKKNAQPQDLILITGSTYVVAQALNAL